MDSTIEELTLLLLALTATRDASASDTRVHASLHYPTAALATLQAHGLLNQIDETSVALTEAGLQLAEKFEERYLNGDERPDLAA